MKKREIKENIPIKLKRLKVSKKYKLPALNSLEDLIELGQCSKDYEKINMLMLRNITPDLKLLNDMIGMKELKESIFEKTIYYLQGLHEKNKEEYLHTVITGLPGCGKCLAKDTPVIMYNGNIKKVQHIKKHDLLMGDDGKSRNVLSVCSGREMMYEIIQEHGDSYRVNSSHILSLKLNKNPDISFVNEKYILKWHDRENVHINIFINETDVYEKLEVIPKKGFVVDISIKDYIKMPIEWKNSFDGYKSIVDFEEKENIEPYIFNKQSVPKKYKINNRNIRKNVLLEIIYNIGKPIDDYFILNPKSKDIRNDILFLSNSLSYQTKIVNDKIYIKPLETKNFSITVKKLQSDEYFGFTIDGNRRFLLGDFTVTHNTTVAKIIGNMYKNMGILSKNGPFRIAHRDDFIAGYLGQTSLKTKALLESCLGGVLFIDEAYSLGYDKNSNDSFSKEAIDTLCGFLSKHTTNFCCIIAGYKDEINNNFFRINQGLNSRFPWRHNISEYNYNELSLIFLKKINEINWVIIINNKELVNFFKKHYEIFRYNSGRVICNFLSKTKVCHSKRILRLSEDHKFSITLEDMKNGIKYFLKMTKEEKTTYDMYT